MRMIAGSKPTFSAPVSPKLRIGQIDQLCRQHHQWESLPPRLVGFRMTRVSGFQIGICREMILRNCWWEGERTGDFFARGFASWKRLTGTFEYIETHLA